MNVDCMANLTTGVTLTLTTTGSIVVNLGILVISIKAVISGATSVTRRKLIGNIAIIERIKIKLVILYIL
jgi:hypothetical protein